MRPGVVGTEAERVDLMFVAEVINSSGSYDRVSAMDMPVVA